MAIADKAFFRISLIKNLDNAIMSRGVIDKLLSKAAFERIFKNVLEQFRYFGSAIIYAIKRCFKKIIDGKPFCIKYSKALLINNIERYTAVKRSQHLIQNNFRIFDEKYVANISSINRKRAFLNEAV